MMHKSLHHPTMLTVDEEAPPFLEGPAISTLVKWDPSPEGQSPPLLPSMTSRFKITAIAILASLRFRRMILLKVHLVRGTPISRWRACSYAIVSITRLRTTLPQSQARRRKAVNHLLSMQRYPSRHVSHMLNVLKTYGHAVVFSHRLNSKLHERHLQCSPLNTALETISQMLCFKLDQALNAGKCKVLLHLSSSIASHLNIMRFVLDNFKNPLEMGAYKELSACYYTLKDLCRLLLACKQFIQDCTGFLPSHKVFAKLENIHTVKFILLDLFKCYQLLVVKFEGFVSSICDPLVQEFAWDCKPPSLPGSCMGHYLYLQAEQDLCHVLTRLEKDPKSYWSTFMSSWKNVLNAAEDMALRGLLLARLSYPSVENEEVEFLKKGLCVDKKYIRHVRFLGSGSYGTVDEVLCFGEKYAMKTIKGIRTIEDANEAVIQARLHHPNIVNLMWYTLDFESPDTLSLLMDLMTCSLEDFIEQQIHKTRGKLFNYPLVPLHIMMQIAKAMVYLHSQDIMHRDLKAANVLVDATSYVDAFNEGYVNVKVADFGLSKVKRMGSQNTMNTRKVGTKYWRAPEVFWEEPAFRTDDLMLLSSTEAAGSSSNHSPNYSFSADVYSFAMTCYEIITGKKPFADLLENGMTERVLKERIVKLNERPGLPHDLHPGLKDLIEQCWDGTPENRPTFEAICQRLDEIKDEFVFGSHPQSGKKL
eukprot:c25271_g1_i2 orf=372-2480(-)